MVHKFVDHKFVYQYFFFYLCNQINLFVEAIMDRAFVYGMSVVGDNFTDRDERNQAIEVDRHHQGRSLSRRPHFQDVDKGKTIVILHHTSKLCQITIK